MKYMFVLYFFLIHRELSKLIAQKTRKYDGKNTSAGLKSCLSSIQVHSSRRSLYSWFPLHFNILKSTLSRTMFISFIAPNETTVM